MRSLAMLHRLSVVIMQSMVPKTASEAVSKMMPEKLLETESKTAAWTVPRTAAELEEEKKVHKVVVLFLFYIWEVGLLHFDLPLNFLSNQFNARELWVICVIWWELYLACTKVISISAMDYSISERLVLSADWWFDWEAAIHASEGFRLTLVGVLIFIHLLCIQLVFAFLLMFCNQCGYMPTLQEEFEPGRGCLNYFGIYMHGFSMLPFACELYLR